MRTLLLLLLLLPGYLLAQTPAAPPSPPAAAPPAAAPPAAAPPAAAPAAPKKAAKEQVYKWVDDKGVIHYTDKPPTKDATPAQLPPLQTYKGGTHPNLSKFEKPAGKGGAADAVPVQIQIVTPSPDETFRGGERVVPVAVMVTPQLGEGQKLVYLLDGTPQSPPTTDTSFAFTEVDRGSHTASVTLFGPDGQELGSSSGVTFHMKPPIAGQAQKNAAKPAQPNAPKPKPKPSP